MQEWEELLFENRNKAYGSYLLRKKYTQYLLLGFLFSVLISAVSIGFIYYNYNHEEEVTEMPMSLSVELNQVQDEIKTTTPPPPPSQNDQIEKAPVLVDSVKEEQKKMIKKDDGNLTDSSLLFSDKQKASGNGFDSDNDSSFYVYADELPQFYGGEPELRRFLQKNFNYPESSRKAKKHGKIIVQFIVSKTGDVKDISIQSSFDAELDKEVIRVISMLPKWKPGRQGGRPVNVMFRIPINLKL
jgi:periplasmic protein TonB